MMERILWSGGMVVVGGLLVACATQEGVLRDHVVAEMECPPAGVEIVEAGPDTFDVKACGERATYVCTSADDPGGIACTRQEGAVASAGGETTLDAEDAEAAYGVDESFDTDEASGTADASDAASEVAEGATEAPQSESTAAGEDAGGETGDATGTEAAGDDVPEEPGTTRAGPPTVENAVRRAIDERKDVILECVGRDHVVVSASYRRTGVVRVSLRGDLQGTAEERCVAAALRDLRVNTRRTEGVVLHPVHR